MRRLTAAFTAAAALTALGLGASSVAAADSPSLADDVAARLGVSTDTLRDAFRDALEARVDAAVKAGRLTPEQGARLKERIASANGLAVGLRRAIAKHRHALVGRLRVHAPAPGPAARYLGISPKELRTELRSGMSLAQIATAHGKTVDGLVDAIVGPLGKRLDRAVEQGWLTRRRADEILTRVKDRVEQAVQRTRAP